MAPDGGIYKSTDGGATWQQLGGGLPDGIVQAYVTVAASNPKHLFASVATKDNVDLYRSGDAGATWTMATNRSAPTRPHWRRRPAGADASIQRTPTSST